MRWRALAAALGPVAAGCVYYNGVWSAEHFASDARKQEAAGEDVAAHSSWAQVAVKAESVVARHPKSSWVGPALVLQAEGLAGSGDCRSAAGVVARAEAATADPALRERTALVAASCALAAGRPTEAYARALPVLETRDARRHSRAAFLAGTAAYAAGNYTQAREILAQSREPDAGAWRVRALLALDLEPDAEALLDTVARQRVAESVWDSVFADYAQRQGAVASAAAFARIEPRQRLPAGARARLLLTAGDRLRDAGALDSAAARYARAEQIAMDSAEGPQARLRLIEIRASRAATRADLAAIQAGIPQTGPSAADANRLQSLIGRVLATDSTEGGDFRAAELARDSLRAPALAAGLFEDFARRRPASLFAPKALLAAASIDPERSAAVQAVLDSAYRTSPYLLAARGAPSPAYAIAEDSLSRLLGIATITVNPVVAGRWEPPRTGPRGPTLEAEPERAAPPPVRRVGPVPRPGLSKDERP